MIRSSFRRPVRCRFCGALMDEGVRYGRAHYAHYDCFLESDKPLAGLELNALEVFPWDQLMAYSRLDEALTAIANKRKALS